MTADNEGQDYKGEFVATGGRSEIRRPSELVPSKPLARMPRRHCCRSRAGLPSYGSGFLPRQLHFSVQFNRTYPKVSALRPQFSSRAGRQR